MNLGGAQVTPDIGVYQASKNELMVSFTMLKKYFSLALLVLCCGCGGGGGGGGGGVSEVEVVDFSPYAGQKTQSVNSWYVINATPPFGPRDHASLIKVNNRIHLSGGFYRGPSTYQDYWVSDDYGVNWTLIHGSPSPLMNNLIYPILYSNTNIPGSYARFSFYDSFYWLIDESTWYSRYGILWNKYAGMDGDVKEGGVDLFNVNFQGVRYSIDPANNLIWNNNPNFKRSENRQININFRTGRGAVVYSQGAYLYIAGGVHDNYGLDSNGKKILLNQEFNNFIWRSLDGVIWKRIVDKNGQDAHLPWVNIEWPCAVNDNDGRVWLVGGYDFIQNKNVSDVWYTADGINWIKYEDAIVGGTVSALFPRHATSCVFDEVNKRIISVAGKGGLNPDNDAGFVTKDIIGIPIP